jgi:hypothetical protein
LNSIPGTDSRLRGAGYCSKTGTLSFDLFGVVDPVAVYETVAVNDAVPGWSGNT